MYDLFKTAISPNRLEAFRASKGDNANTLSRCLWNTALCEAFYPSLHHIEIGLRNSIHNAAAFSFKDPLWFKQSFMAERAKEDIADVEGYLKDKGKDHTDPNRIVAELGFGFWARLFDRHYEHKLWYNGTFLLRSFPNAPKLDRKRIKLAQRINRIKGFRNRIFHHESILTYNLPSHHSQMLETIKWMSPELEQANNLIDRFPQVFNENYFQELEQKVNDVITPKLVSSATVLLPPS
jgi:hypothetical protein